ncbi:hypothetical protein KTE60_11610 [Burkholderia multivorans]|uniref:hypothetical protein n=1 Tax=Burkholderia multivorans TaxID=87883 RepID=UPI001C2101F2|nr:hypothetical protein [Burkholderia multivorans]MBU9629931.1 hypothetical protein [Burkholderia multivorans]
MFEAFKIGVRISLINSASLGLAALSKDFLRTEAQASLLQKRIDSIQKQAKKGALMLGMSAGIVGALKVPYEEAKKLRMEQEKFQTLNLSSADNAKVFATAQTLAHKNLGATIADNIALITDLHTATGDLGKALSLSDAYNRFAIAAKIQNDGKNVDGLVYNSVKALEHRGDKVMQNPTELAKELAMQSQVYFATRGRVSANDYFHASQTGKIAYQLASPEYLYGAFAALISAKTGSTAGTTLMTFNSSLIGGHMDKKAKGFLSGLGLWDTKISPEALAIQRAVNKALKGDPEMRKALRAQHIETPVTGGLSPANAKLASQRPDLFIHDVLVPAMRRKYGNLDEEQLAILVAQHFNRATGDFIGSNITSAQKNAKDTAIFRKADDFSGAYQQYIKSPEGAEVAADAAWKNFLAVFGSVYLPTITNGLLKIAGGLDRFGQFVERHKTLFKILADGLILLAGGLAINGAVLLLTAALRGFGLAMAMRVIGGPAGFMRLGRAAFGLGKSIFRMGGAAFNALRITGNGLSFLRGMAFIVTGPIGAIARGLFILGRALAMQAVGGAAGIARIAGAIAGSASTAFTGALAAVVSPLGIAVLALGTLAAAAYAFRPFTQAEIDSYKTDGGVKLSAGAQRRVDAGELNSATAPTFSSVNQPTTTQSRFVRPAPPVVHVTTYADFGNGFEKGVTKVVGGIVSKSSSPLGSGLYDPGLGQAVPGQGY